MCASAVVMVVMLDIPCSELQCKTTGYPLHSHIPPSLPLPCVTVCHQVSTELYSGIEIGSKPAYKFCFNYLLYQYCILDCLRKNQHISPVSIITCILQLDHKFAFPKYNTKNTSFVKLIICPLCSSRNPLYIFVYLRA